MKRMLVYAVGSVLVLAAAAGARVALLPSGPYADMDPVVAEGLAEETRNGRPAAPPGPAMPEAVRRLAPELLGRDWINVDAKSKVSLAARKGQVTLVHYWTYG